MQNLNEKLFETSEFLCGIELVSIRGSMAEKKAIEARTFARDLVDCPQVDWISITDNAGGNPQLAPYAIGKPILYAGKEVVIHMTCKDLNRNGLESRAWFLNSEGFHNILAMTGDYPVTGDGGRAKPVFDIDSVALISMLNRMNQGFDHSARVSNPASEQLKKTEFLIGAVTTNFKLLESEVVPQYLKLEKKVACGAHFIINQIGFDARKMRELKRYMDQRDMGNVPLIGNCYRLNPRVAQVFHDKKIPGVVVTPELLDLCQRQSRGPDGGEAFFLEFAAKQVAIYRGLGYRGVYLGGISNLTAIERIMEIERTFSLDDWQTFAREIRFSRPGEYYHLDEDRIQVSDSGPRRKSPHAPLGYRASKRVHELLFTPGTPLHKWGARACQKAKDPSQGPKVLRVAEHLSKSLLFGCKDCGDCSLPDIAYLCPESQCAKNQRNGPCGGTREGRCEVDGYGDCIWLRAYERRKADGNEQDLLQHAPMVQDEGLRRSSSWANSWLERDHAAKRRQRDRLPSKEKQPSPKASVESIPPDIKEEKPAQEPSLSLSEKA